ncbi:hypothetical protein GALL_113720 [mine drainage metagenome]|uniref:Ancillary SecYEG translocon subunit/Cell division coordinator CpoB TPR domain-containing protein n=1 Tax=mine drainage metagenome TaxID=410659 RepID=A0A1J5SDJ0_9ZZZZ
MSTPASPSDPKAAAPAQSTTGHTAENFAESLQLFWLKYNKAIVTLCLVVLLGILGYGGYAWYAESQQRAIGREYAAAGDNIQKLQAFAAEHPDHALAGVALLRVADEDYAKGNYAASAGYYQKALPALAKQPFEARAKLGLAMSQLLGGQTSEGVAALQKIAADATQFKAVRAEAAYHLLRHYADIGKIDDANKAAEQVLQVDPSGLWAQRAMLLRASLGASAQPAAAAKTGADTGVKLTIPGN